jgi:hypothetical protein
MENRGWIPGKEKIFTSPKIGSGAHPASYQMGTGFDSPESKMTGDNSLQTTAEVNDGGAIPPLSICLHGIVLN